MNVIFLFHVAILLLILLYVMIVERSLAEKLLAAILIGLFVFHCAFWGPVCYVCNIDHPVCLIEIAVFWLVIILYGFIRLTRRK